MLICLYLCLLNMAGIMYQSMWLSAQDSETFRVKQEGLHTQIVPMLDIQNCQVYIQFSYIGSINLIYMKDCDVMVNKDLNTQAHALEILVLDRVLKYMSQMPCFQGGYDIPSHAYLIRPNFLGSHPNSFDHKIVFPNSYSKDLALKIVLIRLITSRMHKDQSTWVHPLLWHIKTQLSSSHQKLCSWESVLQDRS